MGLTVNSGATLRTLRNTTAIIGAEINGTLDTAANATTRFQRGTINLNVGANLTGQGLYWIRGDVFGGPLVSVNTSIAAPANLLLENGTLGGTGVLTVSTGVTMTWRDNAIMSGTGQTVIQSGALLRILGTGANLSQRTVVNQGGIQVESTDAIFVSDNATIDNRAGAVLNFLSDASINAGAIGTGGTLINAGQIRKLAGVGNTGLNIVIQNTGQVDVQSGSLSLRNGTSTGTFNTAAGSSIDLTGGLGVTFLGTNAFTGNGIVNSGGGDMRIGGLNAAFSVGSTVTFNVYGVTTVPIGSTLTVNGNLNFNGASDFFLRGGGLLISNGNITHSGTGNLVVSGDVPSNLVATTLRLLAGRFYNFDKNSGIITPGGGGGVFENFGTIRKRISTGTSPITVQLVNNNAVAVAKGTLAFRNVINHGGTFSLSAGTTLQLTDGVGAHSNRTAAHWFQARVQSRCQPER